MFKKLSLSTKIIGVVIISILMVAGGAFWSLKKLGTSYTQTIEDDFQDGAMYLGMALGAQYYERYGDVQAFAINEVIRNLDSRKMPEVLDAYVALYGIYDLILVVDSHGVPLASNIKDTSGKEVNVKALQEMNFRDAPWFKAVMEGRTSDDKELGYAGTYFEPFMQDPILKTAFGESRYSSGFSAPIKNAQGQVTGVVTNRANLRWFENEIKNSYRMSRDKGLKSAHVKIFNGEGLLLVDYDPTAAGTDEIVHAADKTLKKDEEFKQTATGASAFSGKTGHGVEVGSDKISELIGYHWVNNSKWPKSIGWVVTISVDEEEIESGLIQAMHSFYVMLGLAVLISILISISVTVVTTRAINKVSSTLSENSTEVAEASQKIASSATQLSESATEQAAALQETVAAVDEISAMVEKNAESAVRSKEVSGQSREMAEKGRSIVGNMLQAIGEIDQTNDEISTQMDTNNRQLAEITNLINDIGAKTKVINEIVFQTKLLSFNASVEAARAGEYGKGFAVVAEEVGNLAEMSGNSAKEISSLLETLVRKVETIVSESKSRIERMMDQSKEKVRAGSEIAQQCNTTLEEILQNVQSVDALVSEIAVASNEQSSGIREISKAVTQMEQVTQQNSAMAQSSSSASESLKEQSATLSAMTQDLIEIISGKRVSPAANNVAPIQVAREKKLKRKNAVKVSEDHQPVKEEKSFKMASSGDVTPSGDDPGFQE